MKAIQIKYLAPTDHKPARWKAFVEGAFKFNKEGKSSITIQAYNTEWMEAAKDLITELEWNVKITGSGALPNGDYVVTIE